VPDPFGQNGGRLYRTGDRVRHLPDGSLEFLGRLDDQIKLRGHRIELGEIERVLEEHEAVTHAVATLWRNGGADAVLAGYVVLRAPLDASELRDALRRRLPEYMLPATIVALERLPIGANGKIDRRALPSPERVQRAPFVEPRNETESALAAIWAELFGRERVGVEDDFFELGGHSLLATRLMARVNEHFGTDVPLRRLFEAPTIARLAQSLQDAAVPAARVPVIQRQARRAAAIRVEVPQ
jgi:acyl carrier protein